MRISEFCNLTSLTRDTIRFYERQGLLQPRTLANGYRDYSQQDIDRVADIQIGRLLGFTLREIRHGLDAWKKGKLTPAVKKATMEAKLAEVRAKLAELKQIEKYLVRKLKWMAGGESGPAPQWAKCIAARH